MIDLEPWRDIERRDFPRLLVLADALEEECEETCEGLRTLAAHKRWPVQHRGKSWWWHGRTIRLQKKTGGVKAGTVVALCEWQLPRWVMMQLIAGQHRSAWQGYANDLEALLSAAAVIAKTPEWWTMKARPKKAQKKV